MPRYTFGAALDAFGGQSVLADPVWAAAFIFDFGLTNQRAPRIVRELRSLPIAESLQERKAESRTARAAPIFRDGQALSSRFLAGWRRKRPMAYLLTEIDTRWKNSKPSAATPWQWLKDVSFDSISGAGPHGAVVHYQASPPRPTARIEPDRLFLIDSGAQFEDGTTDVTRTVAIGEPSAEMRDRFTRCSSGKAISNWQPRPFSGRHHGRAIWMPFARRPLRQW